MAGKNKKNNKEIPAPFTVDLSLVRENKNTLRLESENDDSPAPFPIYLTKESFGGYVPENVRITVEAL